MSGFVHYWDLMLEIEAPFATAGVQQQAYGFDISLLRNFRGELILSGDQVEGITFHILKEIGCEGKGLKEWFGYERPQLGNGVSEDSKFDDKFGKLGNPEGAGFKVFDLVLENAPSNNSTLTRIEIDEETETSKRGSLVVIEQPFKLGSKLKFKGRVRFLGTKESSFELDACFRQALEKITALGLAKSSGFGRMSDFKFCSKESSKNTRSKKQKGQELQGPVPLTLAFNEPFLVDPSLISSNIYLGNPVIPGSVLKGTLFRMLSLSGLARKFNDLLDKCTFQHAFPAIQGTRIFRGTIPMDSIRWGAKGNRNYGSIFSDQVGEEILLVSDWNSDSVQFAKSELGIVHPTTYTRTRTAIGKDGTSQDSQLFSQSQVCPRDFSGNTLTWHTTLIPPRKMDLENQERFGELVKFLRMNGFATLGKTSAEASVETGEGQFKDAEIKKDKTFTIELATAATLLSADILRKENGCLFNSYSKYFESVLCKCSLTEIATDETWAGGFEATRAALKRASKYEPFLLTMPGSVFKFCTMEDIELGPLLDYGLPSGIEKANWSWTRYLPENGYGEVKFGGAKCYQEPST